MGSGYPTASQPDKVRQIGTGFNFAGDCMKRGYVTVNLGADASAVTLGGAVHMRAQAAAKYLAQLLKANGGDLDKALASYNWGIGNVQKHGMALMPKETRDYIPKVRSTMPGATINQETHITVNGAMDARKTADAIAGKQDGVNSRLAQPRGPK